MTWPTITDEEKTLLLLMGLKEDRTFPAGPVYWVDGVGSWAIWNFSGYWNSSVTGVYNKAYPTLKAALEALPDDLERYRSRRQNSDAASGV